MEIHRTLSSGNLSLSGYGITTVFLNPSSISVSNGFIKQIEYVWGDGDNTVVERKVDVSDIDATHFAYPADKGDPRNVIVSHDFYPARFTTTNDFITQVWVTYGSYLSAQLVETVNTHVYRTALLDNGSNNGYAKGIHLVANRMWGSSDQKMFVIETVDPLNSFILVPSDTYQPIIFTPTTPPPTTPPPTTPPPTTTIVLAHSAHDVLTWSETSQYGNTMLDYYVDAPNNRIRFRMPSTGSGTYLKDNTDPQGGYLQIRPSTSPTFTTLSYGDSTIWYGLPVTMIFAFTNSFVGRLNGNHGYMSASYSNNSYCSTYVQLSSTNGGGLVGAIDFDLSDSLNITATVSGSAYGVYTTDQLYIVAIDGVTNSTIATWAGPIVDNVLTSFSHTFALGNITKVKFDYRIYTTENGAVTAYNDLMGRSDIRDLHTPCTVYNPS